MKYDLPTALVEGRAEYLAFYRQLIESVRITEPDAVVELMLMIGDGTNRHGSRFNLPLRIDIVSGPPTKPSLTAAELEEILEFEPSVLALPSGRSAQLSPFPWHGCDVLFAGSSEVWTPVLSWFDIWFDRQEKRRPDDYGLSGVVHSMSEPQPFASKQIFTVDFGSAEIEAFEELITVLDSLGLSNLAFGMFSDNGRA
jgi:hypothetical protein